MTRLVVLSDFGDSWVEEQESGKKVRAGAGKLETDGAFYSSAVFGFESSVQVTGRQLEIEAHVNASFGWLEAFSLAPYAISLVRADAWMDLSVDGEHYSTEQVPLLRGVSPPGGGGEVGMWQEDDAQASASHSFRTVLWPPSGGERLLSVTELIRFSAIRVGDPKRCGATATGTFTFDPLRVTTASGPPL